MLVAFECYMESIFGLGKGDLVIIDEMAEKGLKENPNNAWYLWFKARSMQLKGQIEESIPLFKQSIENQTDLKQLHNICYWELLWCHA
jgi:hypothetical protein